MEVASSRSVAIGHGMWRLYGIPYACMAVTSVFRWSVGLRTIRSIHASRSTFSVSMTGSMHPPTRNPTLREILPALCMRWLAG
ncbi:hypothetical protein JB92DRAFT_1757673 [Gautieria morchelliformis]|nr:hypothetical protein JB92DRAFT_1757673 [Gautieria morchelliformis]